MKRVIASLFIGLFLIGSAAAQTSSMRSFRQVGGATHELATDELVASHPSLPMGTRLTVTNTENGREVIVTVTGRISASQTRVIDLSRGVASQLEMGATGTTPVTIEIARDTEQAAVPAPSAPEPVEEPPVVLAAVEPPPAPVIVPAPEPLPAPVVVAEPVPAPAPVVAAAPAPPVVVPEPVPAPAPVVAAAPAPPVVVPEPVPAPAPVVVAEPAPAPVSASTTPLTIYNTITVESSAPAVSAPVPSREKVTPATTAPQLVKVIQAPVYYPPVTTIPVTGVQAYYPSVTVPLVTTPAYYPPAASVPVIVAPVQQVQTQCPPGLSTYPTQVYTVPAPQAYRQVQSQPSYGYTQPQQQYVQPQSQPSYAYTQVQPQQQYAQPQQQYTQPQQQYVQPQQQYTQPQQAVPQVQVYTAPTQASPVAVYTAPAVQPQPQVQTYSTGAAVIKPRMPDPASSGVYRVQVGSYADPQNAQVVAEALVRIGLSPAYEQYGQNWRVVLPGISAQQLNNIAQYLGTVGIREAWIRLEG